MPEDGTETLAQLRSWRVGDVTVTRVPEYQWLTPPGEFVPDATLEALLPHGWLFPDFCTDKGELRISVHALLIETPGLRVVVDTCFGDDKGLPFLEQYDRQGDFLEALARAGGTRENVDLVLCTHLHIDHVGWNTMLEEGRWVPTFPNARYLIGAEEYAYATGDEAHPLHGTAMVMRDSVQPVVDAGLVDLVATDHRISPELRLMPTPGHTPGHVSLVIESRGEQAVITGDLIHHPCQIANHSWTNQYDTDPRQNVATRERVFAWVQEHWEEYAPRIPEQWRAGVTGLAARLCDAESRAEAAEFFGPRLANVAQGPIRLEQTLAAIDLCIDASDWAGAAELLIKSLQIPRLLAAGAATPERDHVIDGLGSVSPLLQATTALGRAWPDLADDGDTRAADPSLRDASAHRG